MPTSLIVGALVVAWLIVLVPMIARRRQEIVRTADSALAARVVRRGSSYSRMEGARMEARRWGDHEADGPSGDAPDVVDDPELTMELPLPQEDGAPVYYNDQGYDDSTGSELEVVHADDLPPMPRRRFRPGRGGFDPEAAEIARQAKYAFRRRVVSALLILAVGSALVAAVAWREVWWLHAGVDLSLVGYLVYLRRQVRIEEDVRQRRMARLRAARAEPEGGGEPGGGGGHDAVAGDAEPQPRGEAEPTGARESAPPHQLRPGTAVVDLDDGDPEFDDLDEPGSLPYRRAVGE